MAMGWWRASESQQILIQIFAGPSAQRRVRSLRSSLLVVSPSSLPSSPAGPRRRRRSRRASVEPCLSPGRCREGLLGASWGVSFFRSISDRFLRLIWPQLGPHLAPKIDQKTIKNGSQDASKMGSKNNAKNDPPTEVEKCVSDGFGKLKNKPKVWEGCRLLRVPYFFDLFENYIKKPSPEGPKNTLHTFE